MGVSRFCPRQLFRLAPTELADVDLGRFLTRCVDSLNRMLRPAVLEHIKSVAVDPTHVARATAVSSPGPSQTLAATSILRASGGARSLQRSVGLRETRL